MENNYVSINFHGDLGDYMGYKKWNLKVNSVREALHFINTLTNNKFNNYFSKYKKMNAKYRVLINGKDFYSPVKEINEENIEILNQTQLIHKINNLQTIDIVPFIESADTKTSSIFTLIAGAILTVIGIFVPVLIPVGLALIMGGIAGLLIRPPEFGNFRNIDKFGSQSYLFNGPVNIIGEGGPVPIGYGRMLVGSQVVSVAYTIQDYQTFRSTNP